MHHPSTRPLVCVVTGASSGIGEEVVRLLAEEGHRVALVARREDALREAAEAARACGAPRATCHPADVGRDDDVRQLVADVVTAHGGIDLVVHCAGVVTYGRVEDTSDEHFREVVDTNLMSVAHLGRHLVPVLRRQQRGTLVVVGSLLGHLTVPEMSAYVASKWAVRALTRQLAVETIDEPGVHVRYVAPGSVRTPIHGNALDAAGGVNRPPPPTISPERAARVVVAAATGRRRSRHTSWTDYPLLLAHAALPRVWDRVVGPAFERLSRRTGGGEPDREEDGAAA